MERKWLFVVASIFFLNNCLAMASPINASIDLMWLLLNVPQPRKFPFGLSEDTRHLLTLLPIQANTFVTGKEIPGSLNLNHLLILTTSGRRTISWFWQHRATAEKSTTKRGKIACDPFLFLFLTSALLKAMIEYEKVEIVGIAIYPRIIAVIHHTYDMNIHTAYDRKDNVLLIVPFDKWTKVKKKW